SARHSRTASTTASRRCSCSTVVMRLLRPTRLAHQHDVLDRNLAGPAAQCSKLPESLRAIEDDVCRVSPVVPLSKGSVIVLEAGHHAEPAAWSQQPVQAL